MSKFPNNEIVIVDCNNEIILKKEFQNNSFIVQQNFVTDVLTVLNKEFKTVEQINEFALVYRNYYLIKVMVADSKMVLSSVDPTVEYATTVNLGETYFPFTKDVNYQIPVLLTEIQEGCPLLQILQSSFVEMYVIKFDQKENKWILLYGTKNTKEKKNDSN